MRSWTFVTAELAFALGGLVAPRSASAQVVVALSGTPAPAGGNFGGFNNGLPPALNDSGQVAFFASLTGGSSTSGIFVGAPGALETILLVGDVINVASAGGVDDRTVSSFSLNLPAGVQDGIGMPLNNSGLLVYEVDFTDGSSGIFTSQITPVPEPGTLAVVGLTAAGSAGWRRRASRPHTARLARVPA